MNNNQATAAMALAALSLLILAGCAAPEFKGCSKDARICPDGSAVGRMPPNCEFSPCPAGKEAGDLKKRPTTECPKDIYRYPEYSDCPNVECLPGYESVQNPSTCCYECKAESSIPPEAITSVEKKIQTRLGDLTLKYENSKATLSGTLKRSTPCVDWQVEVKESESLAEFNIFNRNKDAICIQVLGSPQNVSAAANAAPDSVYKVIFENEVVFNGKLS